jgi:hypothetical protein
MIRARAFTPRTRERMIRARAYPLPRILYIVLFDGQSNSVGGGNNGAAITTAPLIPSGLMFNGEVVSVPGRPVGPASPRNNTVFDYSNVTGFTQAREVDYNGSQGETWATRFMHTCRRLASTRGIALNLMFAHSIGAGGQTIAELAPGSPAAQNGEEVVTRLVAMCKARGWTPHFSVVWSQGEAEYSDSAATYAAKLQGRITDYYNAILLPIVHAEFPEVAPFQVFIAQLGVRGFGSLGLNTQVGQGTINLALANPQVVMAFPQYVIDKAPLDPPVPGRPTDTYHLAVYPENEAGDQTINRAYAAEQVAWSYVEFIQNGELRFLRPVKVETDDNSHFVVTVTDNPHSNATIEVSNGPLLVSGSSVVPAVDGAGFMFDDEAVQVQNVTVTGATTVEFDVDVPPERGSEFRYALSQPNQTKPNSKGNLRDSRAGSSFYNPSWGMPRYAMNTFMDITYNVGDSPDDVSGLVAWFRADTGLVGSGRETTWTVKSGTSSIEFPTSGKQPIVDPTALNGLPGLYFNVTRQDYGNWLGTFPSDEWAVFFIGREDPSTPVVGNSHVFSTTASGNGRRTFYFNDTQAANTVLQNGVGTINRLCTKGTGYVAGTDILFMCQTYDNSGDRKIWGNSAGQNLRVSDTAFTDPYTPSSTIGVGTTGGLTTGNLNAWIGDILIYNRKFSGFTTDLIDYLTIQNYATQRYGFEPLLT